MGISAPIDAVPAICLGTPDVSVYEMVGAYLQLREQRRLDGADLHHAHRRQERQHPAGIRAAQKWKPSMKRPPT